MSNSTEELREQVKAITWDAFMNDRHSDVDKLVQLFDQELAKRVEEAERKVWQRVAVETRAVVCECGEKWINTDLGRLVEKRLTGVSDDGAGQCSYCKFVSSDEHVLEAHMEHVHHPGATLNTQTKEENV